MLSVRGVLITILIPAVLTAAPEFQRDVALIIHGKPCPDANAMIPDLSDLASRDAPQGIRLSIYCGRIDDRPVKVGQMKPEPAEWNLADALEALLAQPAAAGGFIPKPNNQETEPLNPN